MTVRHPDNPLIIPAMVTPSRPGYLVKGVFNPGAAVYKDSVVLLARTAEACASRPGFVSVPYYRFEAGKGIPEILEKPEDDPELTLKDTRGVVYRSRDYLSTVSHLRLARSTDGVHFTVEPAPFMAPHDTTESYGVEDARITRIGAHYYITYTAVSEDGWATALAVTDDFVHVRRKGIIFPPLTKNTVIFPEKIRGGYYALTRPHNSGFGRPSIWLSRSPDLLHWGEHQCVLRPRNLDAEAEKIGPGPPPIKTGEGWLIIYHAKGGDGTYSLFPALLDPGDPSRVLRRSKRPFFRPVADYEREGFVPNVVFSNGVVTKTDGRILLYYGCCDQGIALAETTVGELLDFLRKED
jgi:predicted GH43/DUF377 family glycosyl hydrolase